jgi:hypothetical protein
MNSAGCSQRLAAGYIRAGDLLFAKCDRDNISQVQRSIDVEAKFSHLPFSLQIPKPAAATTSATTHGIAFTSFSNYSPAFL